MGKINYSKRGPFVNVPDPANPPSGAKDLPAEFFNNIENAISGLDEHIEDAATDVQVTDKQGFTGEENKGKKTFLQTILDKIVEKMVTSDSFQNILKKYLVNNGTTTAEGYGLDARYGKTLKDAVDELNSGFIKDGNTSRINMGKSTDGNSYFTFYDTAGKQYQLLWNESRIWFASDKDGTYETKWNLNPSWSKSTVTFSDGFTNTNGVLWVNDSFKIALIKIDCNTGTLNTAGWKKIATIPYRTKENTIDRIVVDDVTRDFQINGYEISCYFENSDANKRLKITKMFLIS